MAGHLQNVQEMLQKKNIKNIIDTGVDFVSSGALTHSAPILDISLKNLHAV